MNQEKLFQAIEFAKANGLKSIEVDGIKMEIGTPAIVNLEPQQDEDLKRVFLNNPFEDMTDEEILYWATPYYDQLQEQKKLRQDAIANEIRDEVPHEQDRRT
jgi:hypothetical protein